jgi:hypothetical protein
VPADRAFVTIGDEATLARAFASSGGVTEAPVLDVLFTNALPGGAWGVAPAIPGAVGGASRGGSLVVLAHDGTDAPDDALTLLHEVGHFMGLSHTSESGGAHFDPLGDTPPCPTLDLTAPATIAPCPDGQNLMFPAFLGVTRGQGIVLTEGQRRVVHGSPLYRAYRSDREQRAARPATPSSRERDIAPTPPLSHRPEAARSCRVFAGD